MAHLRISRKPLDMLEEMPQNCIADIMPVLLKSRRDYPHLAKKWLSDVCKSREHLEIDLLIGADYLWSFQTGNVVRGKVNEPVAVQTELGKNKIQRSLPIKYSLLDISCQIYEASFHIFKSFYSIVI